MKNILSKVITLVLIGVILFSGFNIAKSFNEYWQSYKQSVGVSKVAGRDKKTVDFNALQKVNPEISAWLYGKDTRIDYAVAKAKDNDKYLHRSYDGKYSISGTLFFDKANEPFSDFVTIIYGHHMKDGSMFGTLADWRNQDVYDKHKSFYIYTPSKKYRLDVVAANTVPADDKIYQSMHLEGAERQEFINYVMNSSQIHTDSQMSISDKYVVLSTCSYEFQNARAVVVCKLVPVNDQEVKKVDAGNSNDVSIKGFLKMLWNSTKSFMKNGFKSF